MNNRSAAFDIDETTTLADILDSFPKGRSPMSVILQDWLYLEGATSPEFKCHPDTLLDLAGICCWLVDNERPFWFTGSTGYITKTLKRSPNFARGIDELRQLGLLHFHRPKTGGCLISATTKLTYLTEILGNDG